MGLSDRNYMHGGGNQTAVNDRSMLWALIFVNALMYVFVPPGDRLSDALTLYCDAGNFAAYQLLTAGFLHGSFWHLFFNMWGLYIFGSLVIPHIGKWNFLWLYLIGELVGNLLFLAVFWGEDTGLLGASGAVCAVMMAAALLEPDRRFVMIFMPVTPLKTSTLIICYTVLEIIFQLAAPMGGVAHLAHLGGFAGGYLFLRLIRGRALAWDPLRKIRRAQGSPWGHGNAYRSDPYAEENRRGDSGEGPVSPAELDALLHQYPVLLHDVIRDKVAWYKQEIEALLACCREHDRAPCLTVISDHGMTPLTQTADLKAAVESTGLVFGRDYGVCFDSTMLRATFLTPGAEQTLRAALKPFEDRGHWLSVDEEKHYGIYRADRHFGDAIFLMDPGIQIAPSDMGLKPLNGMHGFAPEDKDSQAAIMSNVEFPDDVRRVADYFGLMKARISEAAGNTAGN